MTGTQPLPSETGALMVACDRCGAEHYRGVSYRGRQYCCAECAWDHIADGLADADADAGAGAGDGDGDNLSPVDMQTLLWAEQAAAIQSASQRDDVCGGAPSADAVAIAAAMMVQPHCAVIATSISDAAGPMTWTMPPRSGEGQ